VERAEALTTYLGRRSHLQRCIEHAPQIYDGRETSTREAPKDVRKPTVYGNALPQLDVCPTRSRGAPAYYLS